MSSHTSALPYNPALDGLRAIAVLGVIEYHSCWHMLAIRGYLGVDVFFVLSGFLITSILLKEIATGGINIGAFYMRRVRRLYPALVALVLVMLLTSQINWYGATVALLYLGDYIHPAGVLGHTWTLGVEEHYYMLWPLALPFVVKMKRSHAIALMLVVYVLAVSWAWMHMIPNNDGRRFDCRMAGLVLGSLLAFMPTKLWLPLTVLGIGTLMIVFGFDGDQRFAEGATAAVIILSYQTEFPFITRPVFTYIGKISYSTYLYHYPIVLWFEHYHMEGWQILVLTIGGSLILGSISYHTIEAYFRNPKKVKDSGVRITKGLARYKMNFTLPLLSFPRQLKD